MTPSEVLRAAVPAEQLAGVVAAARDAWPGIDVPDEIFVAHLASRPSAVERPEEWLSRVHARDVYLACACAHGVPAALAAFDALVARAARTALGRVPVAGIDLAEVEQRLRTRLLVAENGAAPRVADYAGRGELASWLIVIASRELLTIQRRRGPEPRELPLDDEHAELPAGGDPERSRLRALFRADFRAAFEGALAALGDDERALLRAHYVEGLGIDELAARHSVHRATAARWLVRARDKLRKSARRRLRERLRVGADELESILELVPSELDLSLSRVLGAGAAPGP